MADREHLDYLYLLTCADIAGTSPKLWNGWKDRLLADLHTATRYALRRGLEHPLNAEDIMADTGNMALAKLLDFGFDEAAIEALWHTFPDEAFLRYRPDQLVWQSHGILANARRPSQVRGCAARTRRVVSKCSCARPTATACSRRWSPRSTAWAWACSRRAS